MLFESSAKITRFTNVDDMYLCRQVTRALNFAERINAGFSGNTSVFALNGLNMVPRQAILSEDVGFRHSGLSQINKPRVRAIRSRCERVHNGQASIRASHKIQFEESMCGIFAVLEQYVFRVQKFSNARVLEHRTQNVDVNRSQFR